MPAAPPTQVPYIDGPPPSPPPVEAGAPPADMSFEGMAPATGADVAGSLQVVQLTLQTAQAVAQGLDILGQISPAFAATAAQMQTMLKAGVRAALQQGPSPSEPSTSSPTFAGMGGAV